MDSALIQTVKSEFKNRFRKDPLMIASPGRVNIIGEHIDYNNGAVFPAAIDKYVVCGIQKTDQDECSILALDKKELIHFNLTQLAKFPTGHWANYIIGVINELHQKGLSIAPVEIVFSGNIPMGAGLSSSAALENAIVFGLNELFQLHLSKTDMVQISMHAEHHFAGVQCGIMDQFASMFGKKDHAILLNCHDLSFEEVPILLDNHKLVLINSNVKHEHVDSAYNERRRQSEEGFSVLQCKFPELKGLCLASINQLKAIQEEISPIVYKRCQFAIQENARVLAAKAALTKKDWKALGELLTASHRGLQHLYEVSCPEIDFLVEQAILHPGVLGSRMMGGGFGGCTINLVESDQINDFVDMLQSIYLKQFGQSTDHYMINITDGTKMIDL
ncbi:MAG: galactokinase [Chitinophagales bacterium]